MVSTYFVGRQELNVLVVLRRGTQGKHLAAARTEPRESALLSGERVVLLATSKETAMFYLKNLPRWERMVRVVAGLAMILCGLLGLQGLAIGYGIAGVGVVTVLTGFFGFCPMCALAGRRLDSKK